VTRTALAASGVLLALTACGTPDAPPPGDHYLSPLDGQTAWSREGALTAVAEDMDLPPDYPLPDLIRVVDLASGGLVAGTVERGDGFLRFTPERRFRANARYAWSVDVPEPLPHGPSLGFPAALAQAAVFDTSDDVAVLAATREADNRLCLVMSRLLGADDEGTWSLNAEGEAIAPTAAAIVPREEWAADFAFPAGDPGVDALCFAPPTLPEEPEDEAPGRWPRVGETLRIGWGDRGPFTVDVAEGPFTDAIVALRRGVE
jgi:hypothetical protein